MNTFRKIFSFGKDSGSSSKAEKKLSFVNQSSFSDSSKNKKHSEHSFR
jgi:hypothetical protein